MISVLESSATKRDAKTYLQTIGASLRPEPDQPPAFTTVLQDEIELGGDQVSIPRLIQGPVPISASRANAVPHVAIVKLRDPQTWDDTLLNGIAKTLTHLWSLGLRSVIVPECDSGDIGSAAWQELVSQQTSRIINAIGQHDSPGAELVSSAIRKTNGQAQTLSSIGSTDLFVGFGEAVTSPLAHGHILVVPPRVFCDETLAYSAASADNIVLALAKFFSGLQFDKTASSVTDAISANRPARKAVVDRIIVIDPCGGTPGRSKKDGARVFINLEEEFDNLQASLATHGQAGPRMAGASLSNIKPRHAENLKLARDALAMLPSTASALITSPAEAASLQPLPTQEGDSDVGQFPGEVKTRRWKNPLIHNLLTDKPIYSASLPIGRIISTPRGTEPAPAQMPTTTLAKKGLPVTVFPNTWVGPWVPPTPGAPRLRLTDTCIDLPRLVHLINDSFNRKLDVDHYLRRVEDGLAGIIIAGEYAGGAILTWERPFGMDEETAYREGRLVPYLDKFAVLKKHQGAGGVADIVFNAMLRDCFPNGVCWRSRKDNPVNRWYSERSHGAWKLPDSNWTMFWTTPEATRNKGLMADYEDVCRNVVPSWEDVKPAD